MWVEDTLKGMVGPQKEVALEGVVEQLALEGMVEVVALEGVLEEVAESLDWVALGEVAEALDGEVAEALEGEVVEALEGAVEVLEGAEEYPEYLQGLE